MLKISRPAFGFLIIVVNATMVYVDSLLSVAFPGSPYTAPTAIFVDAIANAATVLLTTEQAQVPVPVVPNAPVQA